MGQADYRSVVDDMHLTTRPAVDNPRDAGRQRGDCNSIQIGQSVALAEPTPDGGTHTLGVLEVSEKYAYEKTIEAEIGLQDHRR